MRQRIRMRVRDRYEPGYRRPPIPKMDQEILAEYIGYKFVADDEGLFSGLYDQKGYFIMNGLKWVFNLPGLRNTLHSSENALRARGYDVDRWYELVANVEEAKAIVAKEREMRGMAFTFDCNIFEEK